MTCKLDMMQSGLKGKNPVNPATAKCPERWALLPVEDDVGPGHEYECGNCGAWLAVRSNRPIELDRSVGDAVFSLGSRLGQCRTYEGMQIDLFDHVRIVGIIDEAKLWGYGRIALEITLTGQDENEASVVVRKLS